MDGFTRFDLIETSIWKPASLSFFPPPLSMADLELESHIGLTLDLLNPNPSFILSDPFDLFGISSSAAIGRLHERAETEYQLRSLSDRVTALELGLAPKIRDLDRKYNWTAEIKGERVDRKYKWTAEKAGEEKTYTWRAEIKGKGKEEKIYTFEASAAVPKEGKGKVVIKKNEKEKEKEKEKEEEEEEEEEEKEKEKEKVKKKKDSGVKLVEIEETGPGAIAIRKYFPDESAEELKSGTNTTCSTRTRVGFESHCTPHLHELTKADPKFWYDAFCHSCCMIVVSVSLNQSL